MKSQQNKPEQKLIQPEIGIIKQDTQLISRIELLKKNKGRDKRMKPGEEWFK